MVALRLGERVVMVGSKSQPSRIVADDYRVTAWPKKVGVVFGNVMGDNDLDT
jgi:hypothetical protein